MKVNFTSDQQKAIDTLDKSILVAAAAGSGKTAVLVERIIKIITEGKAEVDEMLVVTFTKAAASEMKLKLARAIKDKMRSDSSTKAQLKPQLAKLYRAYISTFDSFAVRVIKEFFYEIDIEPEFTACDEVQSVLLQRQAIDKLFDDAFDNDNLIDGGSFRKFLRLYSKERTEEDFKNDLLSSYSKLRTMPDYFDWAFEKAEELNIKPEDFMSSNLATRIKQDAISAFEEAIKVAEKLPMLFDSANLLSMYEAKLANEINQISYIRDELNNGLSTEVLNAIDSLSFITLRTSKDEKESYELIKDEVKELRDAYKNVIKNFKNCYLVPSLDIRIEETRASYEYTKYYLRMLCKFEEYYAAIKKENGFLDFSDMEHYAVRILKNQDAADTLRKRFKYIFIDEYQDTNNIQEHLISRISRPNNVFKVGDVKQSIYRFRQAEPAIFERTYKEYSEQKNEDAIAIDLNKNFRSNDGTLQYINKVFESLMDGYDDRAKLYTGQDRAPGYQDDFDFKPEVHVLVMEDYEENSEASAEEEIVNIGKEESEMEYVSCLIEGIIGTTFYDTAAKEYRKAEAKDIAVLMRSVKVKGELLSRKLRNINVQAHVADEDDFFDTVEIGIAVSLFSCIDNIKRDVPLIATLHSEIFGWTPAELAKVRIEYESEHRDPYWMALLDYAQNGSDEKLKEKANKAISQIEEWRIQSKMLPIEDFIWKVIVESGYYLYAGAMYGGDRRQANLRILVDRAKKYSEDSIGTLSSFLDYIEIMKSKGVKNGQASLVSKDDNVVRITTIHKSKGLEYPFVIVASMGNMFNYTNNEKKFSFDSELGVGMYYVSPNREYWRSTLMQRAINNKCREEEYKEELRVLYVAMTRARNKLYLVGTVRSYEKLKTAVNRRNFLETINGSLNTPYNTFQLASSISGSKNTHQSKLKELLDSRPMALEDFGQTLEEIKRRLEYEYPDAELLDVAAKYSVSAIRREALEEETSALEPAEEVISLWRNQDNNKKASKADIGIAYHRIMEFLDFTKVFDSMGKLDTKYIQERAKALCEQSAIEEEVYKALDLAKVQAFFETQLGQRAVLAAEAGKLQKEKSFTLRTKHKGRDVLVQGVIDCCWEEDGKIILIDYKSSFVNPRNKRNEELERIKHEYAKQVELYSEAIQKGLGKTVGEAYLYLFVTGDALLMQ